MAGGALRSVPAAPTVRGWLPDRVGSADPDRGSKGCCVDRLDPAAGVRLPVPVVVVAGAHGWAGASTTTLMLAEASVRAGTPARVVDTASPLRSGFVAAAVTEHGVDATGKWRVGSRGAVSLQRQAHPQTGVTAAPAPLPARDGTVSIVDATWSLADLLDACERIENRDDSDLDNSLDSGLKSDLDVEDLLQGDSSGHWLPAAARCAPLVVTARASVPGLRLLEQALESLVGSRPSAVPVVVALVRPENIAPVAGRDRRPAGAGGTGDREAGGDAGTSCPGSGGTDAGAAAA